MTTVQLVGICFQNYSKWWRRFTWTAQFTNCSHQHTTWAVH